MPVGALCFRVVRSSVRACVSKVCEHDILKTNLINLMQLATKMNWLDFEVKRSKVKVIPDQMCSKRRRRAYRRLIVEFYQVFTYFVLSIRQPILHVTQPMSLSVSLCCENCQSLLVLCYFVRILNVRVKPQSILFYGYYSLCCRRHVVGQLYSRKRH